MTPPPSKTRDNEELVPFTQANNDDYADESDSESDTLRATHRSSESTLIADVVDPTKRIRSPKDGNFDGKTDGPLNLRDGDTTSDEGERQKLIPDGGEGGKKHEKKKETVGWMSLPHKGQLAIITIARLSEPLAQTSLQSYLYYQLKSFDETLPASTIAAQAGVLQSSFAAAQFLTAVSWGRFADSDRGGRKKVILIGLSGTLVSWIGFGFSRSFWQALLFRSMGGALNGNPGILRTMISEIVKEKKYQSRAFLLLPMCFNIGAIIGPLLGGLLADPAGRHPDTFGNVGWLVKFPYAPPNLLSACFLLTAVLVVFFGLDESHETLRYKRDIGRIIGRKILSLFKHQHQSEDIAYTSLSSTEQTESPLDQTQDVEMSPATVQTPQLPVPKFRAKLPFRRIFTTNVICTLIAHALLSMHVGTFNSLWFVFLSTPVYPTADDRTPYNGHNGTDSSPTLPLPPHYKEKLPFRFTGGLGMPPSSVGFAMATLGFIGINLQLWVYPLVNARLGTVRSWRIFLYCFLISYIIAPYLSIVPSRSPPPHEKDGFLIWFCLCCVLVVQVIGKTFAQPGSTILLNNCSPHPSVLGTIHGIGYAVGCGARTLGPVSGGWAYGLGLRSGVVGAVWWMLAGVAAVNVVASNFVREGNGHEIVLEGDVVAEEEDGRNGR